MPLLFLLPHCCTPSPSSTSPKVVPLSTLSPPTSSLTLLLSSSLSLTTLHCIRPSPTSIRIQSHHATLHSQNPNTDLALLSINPPLPNEIPLPNFRPPHVTATYRIHYPDPQIADAFVKLVRISLETFLPVGGKLPVLVLEGGEGVQEGWSGGAVTDETGAVVGIVAQVAGNEIHAVPVWYVTDLIKGVVKDVGMLFGIEWQPMSNMVRSVNGFSGVGGVRITKTGGGFEKGDVVVQVGEREILEMGTVDIGVGVEVEWRVCKEDIGEKIKCKVWKNGKYKKLKLDVGDAKWGSRAKGWADGNVVLSGDIVFGRLSFEFLRMFGPEWRYRAPTDLVNVGMEEEDREVVVVMGFVGGIGTGGWEDVRFGRVLRVGGRVCEGLPDLVGEENRVVEFANGWVGMVEGGKWDTLEGFYREEGGEGEEAL